MFVRNHKVRRGPDKEYDYLKVEERYREDGQLKQRVLVILGNVTNWPVEKIDELTKKLRAFCHLETLPSLLDVQPEHGLQYGPHLILDRAWQELDLSRLLRLHLGATKLAFDAVPYLKAMIFQRLSEPGSKRQCHQTWVRRQYLPEVTGQELELHKFYRALEALARVKDPLEAGLHQRLVNLFNRDLSLVFFDMTSTYFEGDECPLADPGYSRDHRPDRPQINIALLVDRDGLPIAHSVVPGHVLDQQTVGPILEDMRKRFDIERCVFVGDRGMLPEGNQAKVQDNGYQYLTGLQLNNDRIATVLMNEYLPGRLQFQRVRDNLWVYEVPAPLDEAYRKARNAKDIQSRSRAKSEGKPPPRRPAGEPRFIAVYNPARARKERHDRRGKIRRVLTTLRELPLEIRAGRVVLHGDEKLASVTKRLGRHGKYLNLSLDDQEQVYFSLNRQALREVRRREGLQLLVTDVEGESAADLALQYRMLTRIENAFKEIKGFLRLRPVRHWSVQRVRGHAAICVLGYLLERWLETQKLAKLNLTAQKALDTLSDLQAVRLTLDSQTLIRPMQTQPDHEQILRRFGITQLPALLPEVT